MPKLIFSNETPEQKAHRKETEKRETHLVKTAAKIAKMDVYEKIPEWKERARNRSEIPLIEGEIMKIISEYHFRRGTKLYYDEEIIIVDEMIKRLSEIITSDQNHWFCNEKGNYRRSQKFRWLNNLITEEQSRAWFLSKRRELLRLSGRGRYRRR